jgi:hypothetical protein
MWAALRALEDKVELARRRGATARSNGLTAHAEQFEAEEQAAQQHAAAVRALLRLDGRAAIRPKFPTEEGMQPTEFPPVNRPQAERGTGGEEDSIDQAIGTDVPGF